MDEVISYKDIKLLLWINTETQYDNINAQLFFLNYHNTVASSKQKTFFFL